MQQRGEQQMSFNIYNIEPELAKAKLYTGILRAAGYDAHIVGGALRVLAVGGTTLDVDIAVLGTQKDSTSLHNDLRILLGGLAKFELQHTQTYSSRSGFIADWRGGNINIINYDTDRYSSIEELVLGFDYNFNMYLLDSDHKLYNPYPLGANKVWLNTNIATHHNLDKVVNERTPRFKKDLPHLDWSCVK